MPRGEGNACLARFHAEHDDGASPVPDEPPPANLFDHQDIVLLLAQRAASEEQLLCFSLVCRSFRRAQLEVAPLCSPLSGMTTFTLLQWAVEQGGGTSWARILEQMESATYSIEAATVISLELQGFC